MALKKLIAQHIIQMAVAGKLAEIQRGQPLVLSDEKQIEDLLASKAVREPTADELTKLFSDDTAQADGSAIGQAVDLNSMTKDELTAHATSLGITVDPKATKADLTATIKAQDINADEQL